MSRPAGAGPVMALSGAPAGGAERRCECARVRNAGAGAGWVPAAAGGAYPSMASMAFTTAPRKASFSSEATPLMVVPPGEHTASFIAPGCVPVSR